MKRLGDLERERLRELLWQQAAFSGVAIVTYGLMSNHLHLMVQVPPELGASDGELVGRAVRLYGRKSLYVQALQQAFEQQ